MLTFFPPDYVIDNKHMRFVILSLLFITLLKPDKICRCVLTAWCGVGSGPTAYKEVQPAKATPAVQHAPVPLQPSTAGNEPVPTRVVQEADDGKARFVCCGFGEKRAGSKARK